MSSSYKGHLILKTIDVEIGAHTGEKRVSAHLLRPILWSAKRVCVSF